MSYDHSLLFERICNRLHDNPRSSIEKLSRELIVGSRTIQDIVFRQSDKTFSALREEILIAKIRQIFTSQPGLSIKEVSYAVGYSPRSFGRAVKRASGFSPRRFRSLLASQTRPKDDVLFLEPVV